MVWAVIISIAMVLASPGLAFADEEEETIEDVYQEEQTETVEEEQATEETVVHEMAQTEILAEVSKKLDALNDIKEDMGGVRDELSLVSTKIDALDAREEEVEPEYSEPLEQTRAVTSFSAYASVSATSQQATWAKNTLPKMGWSEHYVFLQDTSSSYVLVWGNLTDSEGIAGTECNWIRWYNQGAGYGWQKQEGDGAVTVTPGSYVVLSSLRNYPLLDDGESLLRNEVAFYAVVAVLVCVLHDVFGFVLRMRSS